MSKKLNQVLAGATLATSMGVWGLSQAQGDVTFMIRDMTYGLTNGTISVTATSITLGLYASFSGAGVTVGGLNLTRGYFGATGTVDATGSIFMPPTNTPQAGLGLGALFNTSGGATGQVGVSANINGDGVTDWGDLPSNTQSNNFFFVDASAHPKPANGSGAAANSTATGVLSVLVGTFRLSLTSIAPNGTVQIGYGLSNAESLSDPLFAKTIWAENFSVSTDANGISGVSNVKNEISNPGLIHFTPYTLKFAVPTWSSSTPNADWGYNAAIPESTRGANWSTGQSPDGAGFPVVFASPSSGTATVSTPHTVGAITFTGSTAHNFVQTSFTGTTGGTATAITTTSGSITLSRGNLTNAIVTTSSSVNQTLNVPMVLVSSGTIMSTTGAGNLNLGTVAIGAGNTLTIAQPTIPGSYVVMQNLNGVAVNNGGGTNVSGRGNLIVNGKLRLANDVDGGGNTNLANRNTLNVVSVLDSLTLGTNGLLDIGNHDLIIRGNNYAQAQAQAETLRLALASGFNGGTWDGATGIITTGPEVAGIGYGIVSDLVANNGFNGVFDGVGVNANDIIVKYTWGGDTNLDGVVDSTDYGNLDLGFIFGLTGWGFGDLNYDGVVDASDYGFEDLWFIFQGGYTLANGGGGIGASPHIVPEPASLGLLGLAAGSLLMRRSKSRK